MPFDRINDRYDLQRRLGAGGMGDVWLAQDDLLGRRVAMKFVGERELNETPGAEDILRDEARHAGQLLGHPQVVAVLDLIDVDTDLHTGPAVVLEYVEGCTVGHWIALHRKTMDAFTQTQTALYIVSQVTEAVHAAHKLHILHRDVKPQNVLCSVSGHIKVADFGLSRVVEAITRTHTVWGRHTPLYAASEQWEGEKPTEDSDVYQLCATAYHLIAGVPANEGQSMLELLRWHETGTLTPLSERMPDIDSNLASILDQGLSKSPGDRPSLWKIFDAVSQALVREPVRLTASVIGCDEPTIQAISDLTDFGLDRLTEKGEHSFLFPHPMEAIQEAVGATILGGRCTLEVP